MFARALVGAVGEFAASRHGAIHRRQAAVLGLSPQVIARLLHDGVVDEPVPGVLVLAGAPRTWRQQLSIATSVGGAPVVAGHLSGAALHRLDGCAEGPREVITVGRRRIAMDGLVIRQGPLDARDITVVDGIRCTTVPRTLADLGSAAPPGVVEVAFNGAWRRGVSLRILRETAERLHRPGQAGTGVLLALVDDAARRGKPLESPLEGRLERLLERAGVRGVVRQHEIRHGGRFVARADFAVPELRLAFEAHSARFHGGSTAAASDAARDDRLLAVDWHTEYVTGADLGRSAATERRLREVVEERAVVLGMLWSGRHWRPLGTAA
ncbi:MAG: hypothetical protein WD023_00870 [Ilumatobacteraceae bacterium]